MTNSNTDTESVASVLERYRGKRCYFEESGGNNGDELIRRGSRLAIERAQIRFTASPREAEVIIYRGGGSMNDFSSACGPKALRQLAAEFPATDIVVLPQSFLFERLDFSSFFAKRTASTFLFARERYSLEVLRKQAFPPTVGIGIDHDMAFWLRDSAFLNSLQSRCRARCIIVVERSDVEGTTGLVNKPFPVPYVKKFFPAPIRIRAKRVLRRVRGPRVRTKYAQEMIDLASRRWPSLIGLPVVAADISDEGTASFGKFCFMMTDAAAVLTNRLHVGILAAMLGKPTLLREASYHKITGIYEYSLSEMPHVVLAK